MSSETFFKHIQKGEIEKVKEMLTPGSGIDINAKSKSGKTPLIYASDHGYTEIVKLLLEKGADINDKDRYGETALMNASDRGYTEIVKLLLEKGADINAKDKGGQTALIIASIEKNIEMVKLLLEKGADVNAKSEDGATALMYISTHGNIEMVKLLLEKGADVNAKVTDGNTVLMTASRNNRIEMVKLLLEKGADVNAKDERGRTAFMYASDHGLIEIVKLLLKKGADVNAKDINGRTALMNISTGGIIEIVKLLLEKGADINAKDTDGNTALMSASLNNRIEIVKLLLEKGADVNAKDEKGRTVLMYASAIGRIEIVKLLLEKGADINATDKHSRTALMNASVEKHIEIVNLLLENNADINAKDRDGNTALMDASIEGHIEIVKLLLKKGADVNAKNENDETAADLAYNEEIRKLLEAKMDKGTIEMWKGLTKGDIERLNGIFEDNAINYSLCPVCLKYVERSEACMYMKHNCSILKGGYYHKRLYERFKDSEGIIRWCTICSRICYGHSHFELAHHDTNKKPELFLPPNAGDAFENDCRDSSHGGGLPEKLLRFRRLREVAKELQDEIGKISEREALDELVEEVWNAPLRKDTRAVKKITESKKWNTNINLSNFRKGNNNSANAPNIPFEGKKPTKLNSGMNDIMRMEDDNIIQFYHKQKDGRVKEHGCTEESLERYIGNKLGEFGTPNFGYCFLYPQECKARLHPEEVKGHIPDKLYKPYKEAFNKAFKGQRGGNRENVFQEAEDAQCVVIRKNTTSKKRNNRNSRIRTKRNNV